MTKIITLACGNGREENNFFAFEVLYKAIVILHKYNINE